MRQRRRRAAATATAEPLPRPLPSSRRGQRGRHAHPRRAPRRTSSRAATAVAGAWATPTPTSVGPRQETAHAAKPPAPVAVPAIPYAPVPVQNPRRRLSDIPMPVQGGLRVLVLSRRAPCKPQANRPATLFASRKSRISLSPRPFMRPFPFPSPSFLPPVAPRPTRPFLSGISPAHRRAC